MNEPARLIPSCDILAFLQAAGAEFLNLPEERKADLACPSRLGETFGFVVDTPHVVLAPNL